MRDKVGVIDGTLHCGTACDWGAGGAGGAGADTTVAGGAGAGSWN